MHTRGTVLYGWNDKAYDEEICFRDISQLGCDVYDVIIVGAGFVGCALAYELSQYQLNVLLVDERFDVGEATSKGSSSIVHTGFDAPVGTLESELVTAASRKWPELAKKLKIPFEPRGALLLATDDEQAAKLDAVYKKALDNGVDDVRRLSGRESREMEPNITDQVRAGLSVPRETLADSFAAAVAFAEVALQNGTDILLGVSIVGVEGAGENVKKLVTDKGHRLSTRTLVNVAGLGSRALADRYGGAPFDINPRRGQFLIFDQSASSAVERILLPIPTKQTKGVLVIPTIYGNLLAGPTAEDFELGDETTTDTTADKLKSLLTGAAGMFPNILEQPVIHCFSGVRCNCAQGSYLIRANDGGKNVVTVTGIRSTGFSSSPALAEFLTALLHDECGLPLEPDPEARDDRDEGSWPGWWVRRSGMTRGGDRDPEYDRTVCFCENISLGEIKKAILSPLRPRTLDAVKRRTRTQTGRCQGFNCRIRIAQIMADLCGPPLEKITKHGPGTELFLQQEWRTKK